MCEGRPSLVGSVNVSKKIARDHAAELSTIPAVEVTDKIRLPGRDENKRANSEQMTALLENSGKEYE